MSGNALGKRNFTSAKTDSPAQTPGAKRTKADGTDITLSELATAEPGELEKQSESGQLASPAIASSEAALTLATNKTSSPADQAQTMPQTAVSTTAQAIAEPGELTEAQMAELMAPATTNGSGSGPALATKPIAINSSGGLVSDHTPVVELVGRFNQRTVMSLLSNLINWMPADHVPRWLAQWQYAMLICLDRDLMAAGAASSLRRLHRRLDHVMNNEVSIV